MFHALPDAFPSQNAELVRIDPARNMARYYALSVEITLFEDWFCTRAFGRIGARGGRIMIGLHGSRIEAEAELFRLLRAKRARGYVPAHGEGASL